MFGFYKRIDPFVKGEIYLSEQSRLNGDAKEEFIHLENAHVLGQESTLHHAKVHYLMFMWGIRQKNAGEVFGQIIRLIGAITKTMVGLVPKGNTGGSNVSPFKSLPIKPEFLRIINRAKANA